ncbi:hypothetical protein MARPO_0017s0012 [Marchantia polymorpha]|uniref:Uncharacterized protein n=1 Tax=Marchantia polymorpha TaxID=3197 RepID=A0A2R6XFK4_MARPO|nr:hypothetical protein MARPO_0017s0012 [Marchantia polymorpha]|eukprot:PTQ44887.1 hypothetical protein MARPO_0017s0012 [Marchantia polymorpha]
MPSTISKAPFQCAHCSPCAHRTRTPILFRSELKRFTFTISDQARTSWNCPPRFTPRSRTAVSVGVPMRGHFPSLDGSPTSSLVFINILSMRISRTRGEISDFSLLTSPTFPAIHAFLTTILLVVKVPVLSLQIVLAEPIVSQAARWRTKALSWIIFFIVNASVRVIARGSPFGTATTMIVTAMAK